MDHIRETVLPKDDVLQVKRILDDASCGHANTKHVLLGWHEGRHCDPVNVSQVTVRADSKAPRLVSDIGEVSLTHYTPTPARLKDSSQDFLRPGADQAPHPNCDRLGGNVDRKLP